MARTYKHLDIQERAVIETQLGFGIRPAAIAAGLLRSRSTITREMKRNGWKAARIHRGKPVIAGGYRAVPAGRRAQRLAVKPRVARKLAPGSPLWDIVAGHLHRGLSPAQIASTLTRMPDPVRLSYETIYTSLYTMACGHLRSSLLALMRRRHHARRPQGRKDGRAKPSIPEMISIDLRPVEIQMRLVPGHWEGDLIIGKGNLSQVGTLVERTTLFVALVKLASSRADVTAEAFTQILNRFDSQLRLSITYDQGSEMRHHKRLTENTGVDVYFAHPHAPWERGISENTNGLLRQYLPKGTDLSLFSQDQLDEIAWKLNTRPRKTLGWKAQQNSSSQKAHSTSCNTGHRKSIPLHLHRESAHPNSSGPVKPSCLGRPGLLLRPVRSSDELTTSYRCGGSPPGTLRSQRRDLGCPHPRWLSIR